jgi:hypothetical protein
MSFMRGVQSTESEGLRGSTIGEGEALAPAAADSKTEALLLSGDVADCTPGKEFASEKDRSGEEFSGERAPERSKWLAEVCAAMSPETLRETERGGTTQLLGWSFA